MAAFTPTPLRDKEAGWPEGYDDLFDAYIESDVRRLDQAVATSITTGSSNSSSSSSTTPAVRACSTADSAASLGEPDSGDHPMASLQRSDLSARQTRFSNSDLSGLGLSLDTPRTPQKLEGAAATSQDHLTITELSAPNPTQAASDIALCPPPKSFCNSPEMAQPAFSRHSIQDAWAQRLEASADKYSQSMLTGPLSPPPSAKLVQWDGQSFMDDTQRPNHMARQLTYHSMAAPAIESSLNQHITSPITPQASPPLGRPDSCGFNYNSHMTSPASSQYAFNSSTRSTFASPSADFEAMWDGDHAGFPFSCPQQTTAPYDESKVQPWWPPASSTAGVASLLKSCSTGDQYGMHAIAPINYKVENEPRRQYSDGSLVLGDSSSFATGGLMISCMPRDSVAGAAGAPSSLHGTGTRASSSSDMASATFPGYVGSSMDVPEQCVPFVTTPPAMHSSHRSGSSPRNSFTSHRTHHHHSSSSSSHHRRNRTSISKSSVGFVNYTPDDSKKILTGVAPSGSSKTKARREKEAADRRRRLEQAAARAVLEAGGDMAALEREGLLA